METNRLSWSQELDQKIQHYSAYAQTTNLGRVAFSSPFLLAPMAGITTPAFRSLMQDLGAGGSVSELVSCDGLHYKNAATKKMLEIKPWEKNVGLQLFGSNAEMMGEAAKYASGNNPNFIDINMGCPVKKVVTKGGGSALLQRPQELYDYFKTIKAALGDSIPLSIKIRTGWTYSTRNAHEVIDIAKECGIEWVAIHGRTRDQQYTGLADWDYMENLCINSKLDLIGNGDLIVPRLIHNKQKNTPLKALMIGRGALRNPFIFLESLNPNLANEIPFHGNDYMEVIERYYHYLPKENIHSICVNLKKIVVWFSSGFPKASVFRGKVYELPDDPQEILNLCREYFVTLRYDEKHVPMDKDFMNGGHG